MDFLISSFRHQFLSTMMPSPISSPSSATGQMSLLGSLHTLDLLVWLLVWRFTRCLELDRMSLLPRTGGETVFTISSGLGGSGDGIGLSEIAGLRRKHRNSILSIHLFNFAVGDEAAAAAAKAVRVLCFTGDSERERRLSSIPAAR